MTWFRAFVTASAIVIAGAVILALIIGSAIFAAQFGYLGICAWIAVLFIIVFTLCFHFDSGN